MRRILFQMMLSLDEFYERYNQRDDWHSVSEEFNEYEKDIVKSLETVDTLLLGRVNYQIMVDFWPIELATTDDWMIDDKLNTDIKIVYSNTMPNAEWNNTIIIKEFVLDEVLSLKEGSLLDMTIFVSPDLNFVFVEDNAIDEFRLMINPNFPGNEET